MYTKKNYCKRIQRFINMFVRRALQLSNSSNVKRLNWLAGIELREDNYIRRLQNLRIGMIEDNGPALGILLSQNHLPKKRKSKLCEVLNKYEEYDVTSKEQSINSLIGGIKRPEKIIKWIEKDKNRSFTFKYITKDLFFIKEGIFVKFKINSLVDEVFVLNLEKRSIEYGKLIKEEFLKELD